MSRPVPAATPRLSFPAEWEPHAATWTSWPFDDELWEGQLETARRDFAGLVATVARYEPVVLNVRGDDTERDARQRLAAAGADGGATAFQRGPLHHVRLAANGPTIGR